MKTNVLVSDLLSKGVVVTKEKVNSVDEMKKIEMYEELKSTFSLMSAHYIHNISDIEKKMFDYMEKEGITLKVGMQAPCHMYVGTKFEDLNFVIIPLEYKNAETGGKALHRTIALAHELGHYVNKKFDMKHDYTDFSLHAKYHVIHCEIAGWYYGKIILETFGFTNWEEFEKQKYESLLTYAFGNHIVLKEYLDKESEMMYEIETNFKDEMYA